MTYNEGATVTPEMLHWLRRWYFKPGSSTPRTRDERLEYIKAADALSKLIGGPTLDGRTAEEADDAMMKMWKTPAGKSDT